MLRRGYVSPEKLIGDGMSQFKGQLALQHALTENNFGRVITTRFSKPLPVFR